MVYVSQALPQTARDAWGGKGIFIAHELSTNGRIFRNRPFTEIIIGREIRNAVEDNTLTAFYIALRRLIYTYRFLTPDLRATLNPALKGQLPAIRRGMSLYSGQRAPTAVERIRDNEPQNWNLDTLSIQDYVSGVAAHSTTFGKQEHRTENLGSYLMDGFVLPETMAALEAVADDTFLSRNFRIGIVEGMSIAELVILGAWKRLEAFIKLERKIDDPYGHDWKFLSEKLLPIILSFYDGDRATLLRRFSNAVQVRHRVVHRGYVASAADVDEVLSTVRLIASVLEIPNKYRKNWQLRLGMPDPVPTEAQPEV